MKDNEGIKELKRQAEQASGGRMVAWESEVLPSHVREQFWERVLAFENGPFTTDFERLIDAGIELPEPHAMDDQHLSAKLWEVIAGLACLRVFLECTNHLSDRELYTVLWHESLREDVPITDGPVDLHLPESNSHLSLVGTGSDENIRAWLTYYADAESREDWRRDFPGEDIPAHRNPPYDRDGYLPRPY